MQKKKGAKGEPWSGVRNHTAKLNMKAMKKGDLGFFYHTGERRQIVGIVEVIGEYQPDPTDEKGQFGLVEVKAVKDMPKPVTLAAIKANPKLADMVWSKFPPFGSAGAGSEWNDLQDGRAVAARVTGRPARLMIFLKERRAHDTQTCRRTS